MTWSGDRRKRLPADWEKIRRRQLRADDYKCQWRLPSGVRCGAPATDVDHIQAKTDDHSRLQSLCTDHHRIKSAREGGEAFQARRKEIKRSFRFTEQHPSERLRRRS